MKVDKTNHTVPGGDGIVGCIFPARRARLPSFNPYGIGFGRSRAMHRLQLVQQTITPSRWFILRHHLQLKMKFIVNQVLTQSPKIFRGTIGSTPDGSI
jgi:hypothetical protein